MTNPDGSTINVRNTRTFPQAAKLQGNNHLHQCFFMKLNETVVFHCFRKVTLHMFLNMYHVKLL